MIRNITIADFLKLNTPVPLADVRTPAEFGHAHIPGAFNLPLFSNEERVKVGTTYKQIGREEAILLGFDLTGSKWSGFIREALLIATDKKIGVHCWRGGMRSGAMAWALDLYGFEVYLIEGGYKQYRRWVIDQFEKKYNLLILGGMTGSGKTRILKELDLLGKQTIDLENLAQHQGSSYGTMDKMVQPTQEQFENNLAGQLKNIDPQDRVWVEDESRNIGRLMIPTPIWLQISESVLINIEVDRDQRVENLVREYGQLDKDFLITCTERIHKRLGPVQTKNAIDSVREDRMEDFIRIILVYYDKSYSASLARRNAENVFSIKLASLATSQQAHQILDFSDNVHSASI